MSGDRSDRAADGGENRGETDEPEGVGDGRMKHVAIVTADGERTEHGDVYLRHSETSFLVSPDPDFGDAETVRYEKSTLDRVEVTQHHSACFITTAVAGDGPTLDALRGFRDDSMARTPVGRALVRTYYAVSPPVAATLERHPRARTTRAVRWLVERCAGLARARDDARSSPERAALATTLTLLYVAGMAIAVAGHAAIRLRDRATSRTR